MGLFDFFKDSDDYEGAHASRKAHKVKVAPSNYENTSDLIHWLETNKVILLSEKEGLIVYTNEQGQSFLQLYTNSKEVKDEKIDEYVEVTSHDIRDLLDEMPYISYLIINPASDNLLIKREEILIPDDAESLDELKKGTTKLDFEKDLEKPSYDSQNDSEKETFGDETKIFRVNDNGLIATKLEFENSVNGSEQLEPKSIEENEISESITESQLIDSSSGENNDVRPEIEELSISNRVEAEVINSVQVLPQKEYVEKGNQMENFETVTRVSQNLIRAVLDYSIAGIEKFYIAKDNLDGKIYLLVDTFDYVDTKLPEEFVTLTKEAPQASELEKPEFLLYDVGVSKEVLENYSDTAVLNFLKSHPIIYTLPQNGKISELSSFTDISQIPDLFLEAFDEFEVANSKQFNDYLSDNLNLEMVQVNPFSQAIFLKPEAFKSQEVKIPEIEEGTKLLVEIDHGKDSLIAILTILKKFKINNIEISEDETQLIINFVSEKDVVIARQILKLKTSFVIK
ncbi:SseB family protein [Lactovum miscens]|uniref:SseB protein N-terminal domain-containing protein n=1 Tax=Lactovum miscens TaxID=190387 RepID=A0A841C751_9LACT|nr:SseB family protein [Lactovum miscens]MBB5888305.1 hypothetical protein [Lactovum miscens]